LIAIRFTLSRARADLGSVTVSTPFLSAVCEAAVVALAEQAILVFGFGLLLAFDGKDAVRQLDLDVLVVVGGPRLSFR
jgi:hypothetical protein